MTQFISHVLATLWTIAFGGLLVTAIFVAYPAPQILTIIGLFGLGFVGLTEAGTLSRETAGKLCMFSGLIFMIIFLKQALNTLSHDEVWMDAYRWSLLGCWVLMAAAGTGLCWPTSRAPTPLTE